jgi:hypothetical protein
VQKNDEKGRENHDLCGKLPFLTCIPFLEKNQTFNHTQKKDFEFSSSWNNDCSNFFFLFPVANTPFMRKDRISWCRQLTYYVSKGKIGFC